MPDQSTRDRALGRWRSSPTSDFVVYPSRDDPNLIRVLRESTGISFTMRRDAVDRQINGYAQEATRYFVAHPLDADAPVSPWQEATEGEVWMITTAYRPEPFIGLPYIDDFGALRFAATHVLTGIPSGSVTGGEILTVRTRAQEEALR